MAELKLRVTVDVPLVVPEEIPGPSESVALTDGVLISQALLLSEKNGAARFTLEQEEVTLDDEGHVREIVTTRLEQQDRQRRS